MYMSPEQAQGKPDVDHRTDLYSIGAILYEMLSGEVCFAAKTSFALIMKIVKEPPVPPRERDSTIPQELEQICLKALTKDKQQRYQNAGEMIKDLQAYIRKEKEYLKPVTIEEPQEDPFRSSQVIPPKKRRRSKRYRTHTTRRHKSFNTSQIGAKDIFSQSQLSNAHTKKMKSTTIRKVRKKRKKGIGWFEITSMLAIIFLFVFIMLWMRSRS